MARGKIATSSVTNDRAKWTKSIRALPSNAESNDYLKPDYIDVNLNNSRKLIANLNQLAANSSENVELIEEMNERLLILNAIQNNFSWLQD
ncbi:hypothetical protein CAAN1_08S05072 [[Candida] anglica]|uniref:DASH complex subunit DAD4 n=1 Tax=[Candida] anglica TaxID=148631 RepID=A0ABP0E5T6_9ASCO